MSRTALCLAVVVCGCGRIESSPDGAPADADAATFAADAVTDGPLTTCGNARLDPGEDCDGGGCPAGCLVPSPPGSVTIRFAGTVSLVQDVSSVFSGRLVAGTTPIWGRGVYDPTGLADSVADPEQGRYLYTNVGSPDKIGLWMQVGDWSIRPATGNGELGVMNGIGGDDGFYFQIGNAGCEPAVVGFQSCALYLTDAERAAFIDDTLPADAFPPLAEWDGRKLYLQGDNSMGVQWYVEATVDALSADTP
jgi:hypothetical protein